MSIAIKSRRSKKQGKIEKLLRNDKEIYEATLGALPGEVGGENALKEEKTGRRFLKKGGSCKSIREGGGESFLRLLKRERNTFQLPRQLCWTMESCLSGESRRGRLA